jgi:hypothetical protein
MKGLEQQAPAISKQGESSGPAGVCSNPSSAAYKERHTSLLRFSSLDSYILFIYTHLYLSQSGGCCAPHSKFDNPFQHDHILHPVIQHDCP